MAIVALSPGIGNPQHIITLDSHYVNSALHAGGIPFVLPITDSPTTALENLSKADALLLTGGPDIDPPLYGEETKPFCGSICKPRDQLELLLFQAAKEQNMPILAICRGAQVVNVACGGNLYQDIAIQTGSALIHPRHDAPNSCVHSVTIEPDTLLAEVLGVNELRVNSRHHQSVKMLGNGLRASAFAPDGIIEAIEFEQQYPMLAVQWHPECLESNDFLQRKLFEWLVKCCL